ncbi:MAG: hypothetical protein QM652_00855 [Legionella sp.]|uniref:hypothetical protein n=1 Tax=Legionella sp. TaxID=459 RepID=UPI0039E42560
MKFKGSQFEERYNDFWNNEIVKAYNLLKKHGNFGHTNFFSTNDLGTSRLIGKYVNGVNTLINNLYRQINLFDDKEYIKKYIAKTKNIVTKDLNKFKAKIPQILSFISILENNNSDIDLNDNMVDVDNQFIPLADEFIVCNQPLIPELNLNDPDWNFN